MGDASQKPEGKRIRVLQIINSPEIGGIENQLLAFLQRYDRARFVVDVAFVGSATGVLREQYLATGTQLFICKWSKYILPFVWRLFRHLKGKRYDVMHARMCEVSGAAILAAKLARVPTRIASYHHTEIPWRRPGPLNNLAVSVLQWITRQWATKILSISGACLDVYHPDWRHHHDKFEICYNGVDISRFSATVAPDDVRKELGLPAGCSVVGHVGSFREVKNHQGLIGIAEGVFQKCNNVCFLLVGDGALRSQIEEEVSKRSLSGRFVFAGNREDVPRMLAAMDIFVMPSLNEGFGTVVVEAQLAGLPVVASDLPSLREALYPGMHQFCCNPHDSQSMAARIVALLKNPEARRALGRQARDYAVQKFPIDKTVKQLESVYSQDAADFVQE